MSKRHDYQRPLSQERSETAKNFRNQKNYHSNTDSELLDILMEQDIQYLTKLAKQYYGTGKNIDHARYTGEDVQCYGTLCMLIKYHNQYEIVDLGTGKFNTAVFTRKDSPETKQLANSPSAWFVVDMLQADKRKTTDPIKYLNDNTIIYALPRGKGASLHKQGNIDYGHANIMHFPEAMETLQNEYIHKMFPKGSKVSFDDFVVYMTTYLQKRSPEELVRRVNEKPDYVKDENGVILYEKSQEALRHLSGVGEKKPGDGEKKKGDHRKEKGEAAKRYEHLYPLVQSFDPETGTFTSSPNPYEQP